jgi:hypothetical protein
MVSDLDAGGDQIGASAESGHKNKKRKGLHKYSCQK